MPSSVEAHWRNVYAQREPDAVSWFEANPATSLAMIEEAELGRDAAILDVGGGASRLAAELLRDGYSDVTVADISVGALKRAKSELGEDADRVTWIEADVRQHDFGRLFDFWHDRALFHFMVDPDDRDDYVDTLRRTLRPGGHLVLSTFGPDGPTQCSGLPVSRYHAEELSSVLRPDFELLSSRLQDHETPSGARQQFVYVLLQRQT
jgi:SAM-dependent methyltransferase